MKGIWLAVLTFACSVFTAPTTELSQLPQQQQQHGVGLESRQYQNQSAVLDELLYDLRFQASHIDNALTAYEVIGDKIKDLVLHHIELYLANMTSTLERAAPLLRTRAAGGEGPTGGVDGCDAGCVSQKIRLVAREMRNSPRYALLALGLKLTSTANSSPGQPAYLALNTTTCILNDVVGGALTVVTPATHSSIFAITVGMTRLGKLPSDEEREVAGGPKGPETLALTEFLDWLPSFLAHNPDEA